MRFKATLGWLWTGIAMTATPGFEAGNRAFERGQYENAIAQYRTILDTGRVSGPVHHNLANAYLELGREQGGRVGTETTSLGRAIYHYRLARRLTPRDLQNRDHLSRARELVHGQTPREPVMRVFTGYLTLNEWTFAASLCLATGLLILTARLVHAPWREQWGLGAHLLLAIGVALGGMAGTTWSYQAGENEAVTVRKVTLYKRPLAPEDVPDNVLHADPDPIRDGIELRILDQREGGWLQVAFEEGVLKRTGWVFLGSDTVPNLLVFPH